MQERCLAIALQTQIPCFESTYAFQKEAEAYTLVMAERSSLGAGCPAQVKYLDKSLHADRRGLSSPSPARVPAAPRGVNKCAKGRDLQYMGVLPFPSGDHLSSM